MLEFNPWGECRLRCDPLGLIYERLLQRLFTHCISGPPLTPLGTGAGTGGRLRSLRCGPPASAPHPPTPPPRHDLHPHFVQEIRLRRPGTRGPTFGSASRSLLSSGRPRPRAAPPSLLAGRYFSVRPSRPKIGEVEAARLRDRWGPRRFS